MEAISGLVRNIAVVIILASFMELLLPNSSMRRFVQLVMGLFVLMAILSPVSRLLNKPLEFEVPAWSQNEAGGSGQEFAQVLQQGKSLREKGEQAALEEYRKVLERQAKALALTVKGVKQVTLAAETKSSGEIQKLSVFVGQSEPAILPIEPLSGQEKQKPAEQSLSAEEQRISQELKTRLGTLLGVSGDKIQVRFDSGANK